MPDSRVTCGIPMWCCRDRSPFSQALIAELNVIVSNFMLNVIVSHFMLNGIASHFSQALIAELNVIVSHFVPNEIASHFMLNVIVSHFSQALIAELNVIVSHFMLNVSASHFMLNVVVSLFSQALIAELRDRILCTHPQPFSHAVRVLGFAECRPPENVRDFLNSKACGRLSFVVVRRLRNRHAWSPHPMAAICLRAHSDQRASKSRSASIHG